MTEKKPFKGIIPLLFPNYKINKNIFWGILLIFIALFGVLFYQNQDVGFQERLYITCPDDVNYCYNNFYKVVEGCPEAWLCEQELLPGGFVYGRAPSWLETNFNILLIIAFLSGLIVNHALYNKDFQIIKRLDKIVNEEVENDDFNKNRGKNK